MPVKFVKTPPDGGMGGPKSTMWRELAAELRKRPGEWALVRTYEQHHHATEAASRIRNGRLIAMAEGFDARAEKGALYACFKGEK